MKCKHSTNKRGKSSSVQKEEEPFSLLQQLNDEIKSRNTTRMYNAYQQIDTLNLKGNVSCLMYAGYLKGKYYYLRFKQTDSHKLLKKATVAYSSVFKLARMYRVSVKNPKYYFRYSQTLFELSERSHCLFEQNRLRNKAYAIALHTSKDFPNSSSLKWLLNRILKA